MIKSKLIKFSRTLVRRGDDIETSQIITGRKARAAVRLKMVKVVVVVMKKAVAPAGRLQEQVRVQREEREKGSQMMEDSPSRRYNREKPYRKSRSDLK